MILEDQVCSLELAKKLKELGVKQDKKGLFTWVKALYLNDREEWQLWSKWEIEYEGDMDLDQEQEWYAAFTVAELGEMLPNWNRRLKTICSYFDNEAPKHERVGAEIGLRDEFEENHGHTHKADTEADARAKMLIYLIENKLLTPTSVSATNL